MVEARDLLKGRNTPKCAVIIHYPAGSAAESLNSARYRWQVIQTKESGDSGWTTGTLCELAFYIRLAPAMPRSLNPAAMALAVSPWQRNYKVASRPCCGSSLPRTKRIAIFVGA